MTKPNQTTISSLRSWIPPVAQPSEACLAGKSSARKSQAVEPFLLQVSSPFSPRGNKTRQACGWLLGEPYTPGGLLPQTPAPNSLSLPPTAGNPRAGVRGPGQWGTSHLRREKRGRNRNPVWALPEGPEAAEPDPTRALKLSENNCWGKLRGKSPLAISFQSCPPGMVLNTDLFRGWG